MMSPATCTSPTGPSSRPAPLAAGSPVYLDLAYLPGGGAGHLDQNFFLRVRALCYVISGQGQRQEEGLRGVLDALLAGKRQWDLDLQVGGPQDSEVSLPRGVSAQPKDARGMGPRGPCPADSSGGQVVFMQLRSVTKAVCGRGLEAEGLWLRGTLQAEQMAVSPVCAASASGTVGTKAPCQGCPSSLGLQQGSREP